MSNTKTVLVTGASSGLGRSISETLARQGHTVFATMRGVVGKNAATATEMRQLAQTEGLKLHVVEMDVTEDVSVRSAVETVLQTAGQLDVVVNNAGVMAVGLSEGVTVAQMRQMLEVNVLGTFRVTQTVLPHLRQQKAGYLIYISSSGAHLVYPFMGMYGATKSAMGAMAEAWHYELYSQGIDTTIVQSGGFNTRISDNLLLNDAPHLTEAYGPIGAMAQATSQGVGASLATFGGHPTQMGEFVASLLEKPVDERPLFVPFGPFSEGLETLHPPRAALQNQTLVALGLDKLLTRQ